MRVVFYNLLLLAIRVCHFKTWKSIRAISSASIGNMPPQKNSWVVIGTGNAPSV